MLKRNKGMTLIEVIVAIAILGVVGVPLFNFFIDSAVFQSKNEREEEAGKIAEFIIEKYKSGELGIETKPTKVKVMDGVGYLVVGGTQIPEIVIDTKKSYDLDISINEISTAYAEAGESNTQIDLEDLRSQELVDEIRILGLTSTSYPLVKDTIINNETQLPRTIKVSNNAGRQITVYKTGDYIGQTTLEIEGSLLNPIYEVDLGASELIQKQKFSTYLVTVNVTSKDVSRSMTSSIRR